MCSQKKYFFDYIIEYTFQDNQTSKLEQRYILTNSKDDTYECRVYEEDSLSFVMYFIDEVGIRSNSIIDKSEFFKAESISLDCESIYYQKDKYKHNAGKYVFLNNKDTLIDGAYFKNYQMKYKNFSMVKSDYHKIAHYVVENNTEFHKPLMMFSAVFDNRVTSKNIPNGIAKEIFTWNQDKKQYEFIHKLRQFVKIKKYIIIPDNCDAIRSKVLKNFSK